MTTTYQYDGLDAIREVGPGGEATTLRTLAIDEALTRTEGATTTASLADTLGSTLALADAAGAPVTTYTYAPFGETRTSGPLSPNPFRFTGREEDGTGLYYYRARYYDPVRSRFISEDPIGFASGELNFYAYVQNRPLNSTDPRGLFGEGLAEGGKSLGHGDLPGANRFDFNREDRDWRTSPYNPGSICHHFRPLTEIEPLLESAIANCDKDRFERLMHQAQDFFSHYRAGYRCYPTFGNRIPGHLRSAPDTSANAWMEAFDYTKEMIKRWDVRCNCPRRLRQ